MAPGTVALFLFVCCGQRTSPGAGWYRARGRGPGGHSRVVWPTGGPGRTTGPPRPNPRPSWPRTRPVAARGKPDRQTNSVLVGGCSRGHRKKTFSGRTHDYGDIAGSPQGRSAGLLSVLSVRGWALIRKTTGPAGDVATCGPVSVRVSRDGRGHRRTGVRGARRTRRAGRPAGHDLL